MKSHDQHDAWITSQRAHAIANGIPVITVNRVGFEEDLSQQTKGIDFWGSSFVAGPQGEILWQADQNKMCNQVVEIDIIRTETVRKFGHSSGIGELILMRNSPKDILINRIRK